METLGSTYQSQVAVLQARIARLQHELAHAQEREQRLRDALSALEKRYW